MPTRRRALGSLWAAASAVLAGCTNNSNYFSSFPSLSSTPGGGAVPEARLGTGQVKVAVILPLSAPGNAGVAGQAMRNAAEMAFAEFNANATVQLLMKDDAGTPEGARVAAEQALSEGAEIIVGPLFAQSVGIVGQIARSRNIPVIAFSTDTNVATRRGLSLKLSAGIRCATHHAICSIGRETLVCGAHPRQCLWHGG